MNIQEKEAEVKEAVAKRDAIKLKYIDLIKQRDAIKLKYIELIKQRDAIKLELSKVRVDKKYIKLDTAKKTYELKKRLKAMNQIIVQRPVEALSEVQNRLSQPSTEEVLVRPPEPIQNLERPPEPVIELEKFKEIQKINIIEDSPADQWIGLINARIYAGVKMIEAQNKKDEHIKKLRAKNPNTGYYSRAGNRKTKEALDSIRLKEEKGLCDD